MEKYVGELKRLQENSGTSKAGNAWSNLDVYVLEDNENATTAIPFTFFGDKIEDVKSIPIGSKVEVEYFLKGNEWNGKTYVNVVGWSVSILEKATPQPSVMPPKQQRQPQVVDNEEDDDLPF